MVDDPYYDEVARQDGDALAETERKEVRWALERQRGRARFRRELRGRMTVIALGFGLVWTILQIWDKVFSWVKPH